METSTEDPQGGRHLHVVQEQAVASEDMDPLESGAGDRFPPKVQRDAWQWALENPQEDGSLPTGEQIAARFHHKERWGRLIKEWGKQGRFDAPPPVTSTMSR